MTPSRLALAVVLSALIVVAMTAPPTQAPRPPRETQLTSGPGGRILTNVNVWSPDGEWIAYDTRSDPAGDTFDGTRIEMVHVRTKEVRVLYESKNGAHCGVVTWHPTEPKVVFILGPEHPTPDWLYGPTHRQGVIVDARSPGVAANLDARDLTPPFTPGALRGGSHVHVFSPDGRLVSFTYEDHVLATGTGDSNQRTVGVSVIGRPVRVPRTHPRNHDGEAFSVLAARTGGDLTRAFEEAWVGANGYVRPDGTRQRYALAFQGHVRTAAGETISEVFLADLPDDLSAPSDGPLEGTATRRPAPPRGMTQRRLTFTKGLAGPRHWLRSSPDGTRIGFLMADDAGVVQLWTVSPTGGPPVQVTRNAHPVASAFTWHADGRRVAFVMDGSVCVTDVATSATTRLTPRTAYPPRPEACVFSPDGSRIAFVRWVDGANQICVVAVS